MWLILLLKTFFLRLSKWNEYVYVLLIPWLIGETLTHKLPGYCSKISVKVFIFDFLNCEIVKVSKSLEILVYYRPEKQLTDQYYVELIRSTICRQMENSSVIDILPFNVTGLREHLHKYYGSYTKNWTAKDKFEKYKYLIRRKKKKNKK